jgi:AcrR family transcriptional regulator
MVQIRKPEIEQRLIGAARHVFAARGVPATSMAQIADHAGVSTGNVYRYFASKDELVRAAVPPATVRTLQGLIRRRVRALAGVADVATLAADAPYRVISAELLEFCVAHRLEVVILLGRAADTPYERVAPELIRTLVRLAIAYAGTLRPAVQVTPTTRVVLDQIYRGFVQAMVAILTRFDEPAAIRAAVERFGAYHLTGLARLFATELAARP